MPFTTGPLVDALSGGAAPPVDDELALLLAGWRDDLTTDLDTSTTTTPCPTETDRLAPIVALRPTHRPTHRPQAAGRRRLTRVAVAGVATFTVLAGTTGVGAASWRSTPTSPLWPVTRVLYPEHAQVVVIEHTIGQARHALRNGNLDLAAQLINTARHQLADADLDGDVAAQLAALIDALVVDLAARVNIPTPEPPAPPAPQQTGPPAPAAPPPAPNTPTPRPPAATTPLHPPLIQDGGLLSALPLPLPLLGDPSPEPTPSPTQSSAPLLPPVQDVRPLAPNQPSPPDLDDDAPDLDDDAPDLDDVAPDIRIQVDVTVTVDDPTGLLGSLCTSRTPVTLGPPCNQ